MNDMTPIRKAGLLASAILTPMALLTACSTPAASDPDAAGGAGSAAPVVVDLRMRDNAEAEYKSVSEVAVPDSHELGDGMFPYEGIGWENGLVGYRLYLDGRLVSDIFGKQTGEPALANIGALGSYHDLAPWGMDVLKVGPSLGIGGIGVVRDGQPEQFGEIGELSASIDENGPAQGRFTVTAKGVSAAGDAKGDVTSRYSIGQDSPITHVAVTGSATLPLASGIVMHDGAEFWQSDDDGADNGWRYIATFGAQSENKDGLGMALFYRADQGSYGGLANATHYIAFEKPEFEYAFLAAWELDPQGVKDRESFDVLLQKERKRLEDMK